MRILYLNTWCGRTGEIFSDFIKKYKDIDIFCFQEIYHNAESKEKHYINDNSNHNLLSKLKELLPDHNHYYRPHLLDYWGLSIAVKNNIKVISEGEEFVHKQKGYDPENEAKGYTAKNLQYIDIEHNQKILSIYNFHGLYSGSGKTDNADRIDQSNKLINFIKSHSTEFILGGDFNLLPDTESIKMLSSSLRCINLINKYEVKSTRTSLYKKPLRFADYIFVSPNIRIKEFKVLPDEISDHSPLLLEID